MPDDRDNQSGINPGLQNEREPRPSLGQRQQLDLAKPDRMTFRLEGDVAGFEVQAGPGGQQLADGLEISLSLHLYATLMSN